jgi:hypothetical protein
MPKVLKVLKLRKQKVEYLNNVNWLVINRLKSWDYKYFEGFNTLISFNRFFFMKYGDKKDAGTSIFK